MVTTRLDVDAFQESLQGVDAIAALLSPGQSPKQQTLVRGMSHYRSTCLVSLYVCFEVVCEKSARGTVERLEEISAKLIRLL